jgi:hypothetical protein
MSSVFWNPSSQTWKRVGYFGLLGIVVVTSLVGGAALLLRSLLGVKRTCLFALHMSAFDPKRTYC